MDKAGARVQLVERENVPANAAAAYDHVYKSRNLKKMPNVFKALANNMAALEKIAGVGEWLRVQAKFDPLMRELITLTTAQEAHCMYEWSHHWPLAVKLGASPALLNSIGTPQIEREPAPIGPSLRFARLIARNEEVDDETFKAVQNLYGDSGTVELAALVAYYSALARLLNVLKVPLEDDMEAKPFVANR